MSQMTIEERERATRAAVEALETQMQLDELEDHLQYLQLEREKKEVTSAGGGPRWRCNGHSRCFG